MQNTLKKLQALLPDVQFKAGEMFYWSPKAKTIHYNDSGLGESVGQWALLHEAGHASLNHQTYANDLGLLQLEVEAWQAAEKLAETIGLVIDPDHIQECLDTYRDWLYARSTCPTCELNSLQIEETVYLCLNCSTRWVVSHSRFCRPYRRQAPSNSKSQTPNPEHVINFN